MFTVSTLESFGCKDSEGEPLFKKGPLYQIRGKGEMHFLNEAVLVNCER